MKKRAHWQTVIWISLIVIGLVSVILPAPSNAQEDFIRGYQSDQELIKGTLVVNTDDADRVDIGTIENINNLLGVVVRSDTSPVTLTTDTAGVFVATSGKYEVLVSDINGQVVNGDYLTASPIAGVAMKADERQTRIIGQAVQNLDFTDSNNILSTTEVTLGNGSVKQAGIVRLLVEVGVVDNPLEGIEDRAPGFIIRIGETFAGKPISPLRVYGALAILLLSFALGGIMLYSTIRTSFIAIGRNPLSKKSVISGLRQVIIVSIMIFGAGFLAVYLTLTL